MINVRLLNSLDYCSISEIQMEELSTSLEREVIIHSVDKHLGKAWEAFASNSRPLWHWYETMIPLTNSEQFFKHSQLYLECSIFCLEQHCEFVPMEATLLVFMENCHKGSHIPQDHHQQHHPQVLSRYIKCEQTVF